MSKQEQERGNELISRHHSLDLAVWHDLVESVTAKHVLKAAIKFGTAAGGAASIMGTGKHTVQYCPYTQHIPMFL